MLPYLCLYACDLKINLLVCLFAWTECLIQTPFILYCICIVCMSVTCIVRHSACWLLARHVCKTSIMYVWVYRSLRFCMCACLPALPFIYWKNSFKCLHLHQSQENLGFSNQLTHLIIDNSAITIRPESINLATREYNLLFHAKVQTFSL